MLKGVIPVIPSQGSVGASGDLAPLAHMAAVMMSEVKPLFRQKNEASEALKAAGLVPIKWPKRRAWPY